MHQSDQTMTLQERLADFLQQHFDSALGLAGYQLLQRFQDIAPIEQPERLICRVDVHLPPRLRQDQTEVIQGIAFVYLNKVLLLA